MIAKPQDFILEAYIPNVADAPNYDSTGNDTELQGFIEEYEKNCLVNLLGWELYSELKPELSKLPFNPDGTETADQKWIDLVNGKDAYRGLKGLLVSYIFYYFLRSDNSHYATIGIQQENSENAVRTTPEPKAVMQYRKYYDQAVGTYYDNDYFIKDGPVFNGMPGVIWGGNSNNFQSLFQFLSQNYDVYSNWKPGFVSNIRSYDI